MKLKRNATLAALFLLLYLRASSPAFADTGASTIPDSVKQFAGDTFPLMPADLEGIPNADRAYLKGLFSLILESANARLTLTNAMSVGQSGLVDPFVLKTRQLKLKFLELTDSGAAAQLKGDVPAVLDIQAKVLKRAADTKQPLSDCVKSPELLEAQTRISGMWNLLQNKYSGMSPEVKAAMQQYLNLLDMRRLGR
ncbi:MAG: hypothetical protein K2X77_12705 [Candidatus Obscuribacterales bacterium]|nr:hypothetical protein [Candidatus Obscuribacterales bacterium]